MSKKRSNKSKGGTSNLPMEQLATNVGKKQADKIEDHITILKFSKKGKKTQYCISIWDVENSGWKPVACFLSERQAQKNYATIALASYNQVGLKQDLVYDLLQFKFLILVLWL